MIAQVPSEAAFPSMPKTLIAAGAASEILPVGEMVPVIRSFFDDGYVALTQNGVEAKDDVKEILRILEAHHQVDFSPYKADNVARRINRRQHLRGLPDLSDYLNLVRNDINALDELYQDLLIGVTSFYRDPLGITALRKLAIDHIVARCSTEKPIRIWVAGCASGEEAYTIGIEVSESMRAAGLLPRFRILATDIHRHSLDIASAGLYSTEAVAKVPEELRERYFQKTSGGYSVSHELRQRIIFSVHNALTDPPFLDLDLVSCRNLLIYLRHPPEALCALIDPHNVRRRSSELVRHGVDLRGYDEQSR